MPNRDPLDVSRSEWLLSIEQNPEASAQERAAAFLLLTTLPPMETPQPEIPVTYPMKFYAGCRVMHKKSGGIYHVVGLPNVYVLELTREPAYAYLMGDGRICVRGQKEFEDGRFVLHTDDAPVGRYGAGRYGVSTDDLAQTA